MTLIFITIDLIQWLCVIKHVDLLSSFSFSWHLLKHFFRSRNNQLKLPYWTMFWPFWPWREWLLRHWCVQELENQNRPTKKTKWSSPYMFEAGQTNDHSPLITTQIQLSYLTRQHLTSLLIRVYTDKMKVVKTFGSMWNVVLNTLRTMEFFFIWMCLSDSTRHTWFDYFPLITLQ